MPYGGVSGAQSTLQLSGLKVAPSKRSSGSKKGKPPCKYGPRGPDGYCPKRPKSAGRKPTAKKPCKYGPRTAAGLCPKKPKSFAAAVDRDLKAGRNPIASGSSTRTVTSLAAEQAATRAVTRAARKLETTVKKRFSGIQALAAAGARALAPVAAVVAAAAYADRKFNDARRRDIEAVGRQYSTMIASIPRPDGGRYDTGRIKAQLQLADWLRQQLEAINARYDKRAISEREGGFD